MDAHITTYLKQLAWAVMPGRSVPDTRDAQRAHIIAAVQQYPMHQRRFIASCAWSRLGFGGGL